MSLGLIESKSSRKRRSNWTEQECLLLAQLVEEKKNIIRGKCSTGVSTQDKRNAWEVIAQNINTAFPQIQRSVSDCNKKWENLLAKTREEIKRQKRLVGAGENSLLFVNNTNLFSWDCNNMFINTTQHDFPPTDRMSLENFSAVTQIVISVMNLSVILREVNDSAVTPVESQQKR